MIFELSVVYLTFSASGGIPVYLQVQSNQTQLFWKIIIIGVISLPPTLDSEACSKFATAPAHSNAISWDAGGWRGGETHRPVINLLITKWLEWNVGGLSGLGIVLEVHGC